MNYYYSMLSKNQQGCYKKIVKAIINGESIVKCGILINEESVSKIVKYINYDHPEFFYVDFQSLIFKTTSTGLVYQINYSVRNNSRLQCIDELNSKIDLIIGMLDKEGLNGVYEKCRWIHNYFVKQIDYNYDALECPNNYLNSFEVRGVFFDNCAVCEGISKAFKLLCDKLKIESIVVCGKSSLEDSCNEMLHIWNLVLMDREFVHIDITWDICISKKIKCTRFDYFCLSDKYIGIDHLYKDYPNCKNEQLDYFHKRGRSFFNVNQLKIYLENSIKKGDNVLYFRLENTKSPWEKLCNNVNELVNSIIAKSASDSYCIETLHNEKQKCFFFKIIRQ